VPPLRRQRDAPGFVPKGRGSANPAPTLAPLWVTRACIRSQASAQVLMTGFHNGPKRKTPAPKWARVSRRMGEGLGAGGTPPGVVDLTPGRRGRFLRAKLFSGSGPPPAPPALRVRAMCDIDGQLDMPAIGKFEISQMDAKSSSTAAAALDHIARAHREPAGQVICEGGHVKILLEGNNPPETCATNARAARQFRDGGAFGRNFCESLWTMRSRAQPHCSDLPRKRRSAGGAL
jgi:hypothetical protein